MIVMLTTAASTNKFLITSIYFGRQDCFNFFLYFLMKFLFYTLLISLNSLRWAGKSYAEPVIFLLFFFFIICFLDSTLKVKVQEKNLATVSS